MARPSRTALAVVLGAGAVVGAALASQRRQRSRGHDRPQNSRIERNMQLAKVSAKASATYATTAARGAFADEQTKARLQAEFELTTAQAVADTLGNMKGAIMKIGQMASYLDQGLPEPVREVLAELQADAPPMSFELVVDMVREELGGEPTSVFASFDEVPIASASIGQVHRAVTHDGQQVAVKVQYPGVGDAIAADLDNSDMLFNMMGMLFPGLDPEPIVSELRDRITEELDYTLEAANQAEFAAYYDGHPTIYVPAVLPELSSQRVLTSEFVDGVGWAEMLTWPQAQLDAIAETIYRYAFGGIYRIGIFNGDPHPGNYLFGEDGRVTFLDYGLCKRFTTEEVDTFETFISAMCIDRDPTRFRQIAGEVGFLKNPERFTDDQVHDYFSHFYEFVLHEGEMTITPEYSSESVRRYFDIGGEHAAILKAVNLTRSLVVLQRINLGLFALFGELRATADWRKIAEEIWPMVDGPPSTPMGEKIRQWEIERGHHALVAEQS